MLRPIHDLADSHALWSSAIGWKQRFELRHVNRLYASLDWESSSGALVRAETLADTWIFERSTGAARIVIRREPRGPEFARFSAGWQQGGRLTLCAGSTYRWGTVGRSLREWVFQQADGRVAVGLTIESMRLAPAGRLTVTREGAGEPALPLLVTLGWYLTVLAVDDAAMLVLAPTGS